MICDKASKPHCEAVLAAENYDLAATLSSGQAFRWQPRHDAWEGVVASRWVRLKADNGVIAATTAEPITDWTWLTQYLQTGLNLNGVLSEFPKDEPMQNAVASCRGLRLLRQEPWECLASFILSSTKQIVQIQQIVHLLCARFGDPIAAPDGWPPVHAFPTAERIASASEAELRECKMGFRAPYLKATAQILVERERYLNEIPHLPIEEARARLMELPGVGRKIADCVLLFAYGFQQAFPIDVWVTKALRDLYFPKRRVHPKRLVAFAQNHFGNYAGYAQQYLFHYMRTRSKPQPRS